MKPDYLITDIRDTRWNTDGPVRSYPRREAVNPLQPAPTPVFREPPQYILRSTPERMVQAQQKRRRQRKPQTLTLRPSLPTTSRDYGTALCFGCQQPFGRTSPNQEFCTAETCRPAKKLEWAKRRRELNAERRKTRATCLHLRWHEHGKGWMVCADCRQPRRKQSMKEAA